ncbi:MAG: signal peptide peptidase SppA [Candidatus Paceibacterota bacterium]
MNNFLKQNWFKISILILIIIILGGSFYWYKYRPAQVEKERIKNYSEALLKELSNNTQESTYDENDGNANDCDIAEIKIRGNIVDYIPPESIDVSTGSLIEDITSAEEIVKEIEDAESNENIKAILIEINSYGGYAFAGEEIMKAIRDTKKPTIALIKSAGTSAAYLIATATDVIFASEMSDIGSIGVTQSYTGNYEKNAKEGISYNQLSMGKYKDMGDPDKQLTEEEKQLYLRDIKITYDLFIKYVSENRNISLEKVQSLADGSTMMGEQALKNKLIDKIGGIKEVKEELIKIIGNDYICY